VDRGAVRTLLPLIPPLLLGALALAGCGLGAGPAPTAVNLTVSSDFGNRVLGATNAPKVAGQETAMSLLIRNHHVATRYSGGFVQSVDGVSGGREHGAPVDWFYYVNGVEAERGAAATLVHPGDHIWWDRHDWSQTQTIPAVVGSYPEPFLNGLGGRRLPVRVECEAVGGPACSTVLSRLRAAGVPAAVAAPASTAGAGTLRVLVGVWREVRRDTAAAEIGKGPAAGGVYARFAPGGGTLTLLDADGHSARTLGAGAGLIAATGQGEGLPPVWAVTGTDSAGVERAAAAFGPALEHHFALAVGAEGPVAVPVTGTAAR
jgi:hypothetical protein